MSRERPATTVEALRREFDAAFAAPPRPAAPETIGFLALRVGPEPFAVRLLDIAGLVPARKVVPVPSARPALLGITGLRGAILPVYSLARLLGRPGVPEDAPWFLTCGREGSRVALAFTRFEGHVRAAPSDVQAADGRRPGREHVVELVSTGGDLRPVIGIRSLVEAITGG